MSVERVDFEDSTKFFEKLMHHTNHVYLAAKDDPKNKASRISEVVLKITKNASENDVAEGKILKTGPNPVWVKAPQHHVHLFVNDDHHLERDTLRGDPFDRVFSDMKNIKNMVVEIAVYDSQHKPVVLSQRTYHYIVKQ